MRQPRNAKREERAVRGFAARLLAALAFGAVLLAGVPSYGVPPTPDAAFQQATDEYAGGAFGAAAAVLRNLAKTQPSVGAFQNLGNAEWQCERPGEAILAWERAVWLDPYNANARANLRFARKAAQLTAPDLAWYEICSTWLPVNAWPWVAGVSFWFAIAMVIVPGILRRRRADWHQAVAAAGFAVFLLTVPALVGVQTRTKLGVIRVKDTPLRLTPTRKAQALTKLPAGEIARLERVRGDYRYIRIGNDAGGWVQSSDFGLISGR